MLTLKYSTLWVKLKFSINLHGLLCNSQQKATSTEAYLKYGYRPKLSVHINSVSALSYKVYAVSTSLLV